jgi:ribonuclease Z
MERLFILGTGCAMVTKCYNTCFTLADGDEHMLVDTGGGNTILSNLEKCNITVSKIHHLFISHSHNDHIMGVVWIIRAVAQGIINNKYDGTLKIYCENSIKETIETLCKLVLQGKFTKFIGDRILFIDVAHGSMVRIMNWEVTFFNIGSTKQLQFGFSAKLKSDKLLTFLGDEPYRDQLFDYANNTDYLLHEAFCLYSQKDIFKPYEKHHATVKDACENASKLGVKNLILYHTEDKNIDKRKELYIEEGKNYFHGNIMVPDDLEIIEL